MDRDEVVSLNRKCFWGAKEVLTSSEYLLGTLKIFPLAFVSVIALWIPGEHWKRRVCQQNVKQCTVCVEVSRSEKGSGIHKILARQFTTQTVARLFYFEKGDTTFQPSVYNTASDVLTKLHVVSNFWLCEN